MRDSREHARRARSVTRDGSVRRARASIRHAPEIRQHRAHGAEVARELALRGDVVEDEVDDAVSVARTSKRGRRLPLEA